MPVTIADLAAYNQHDELALVVEVKKKFNASTEWATRLRRNISAHGYLPPVKFFLLALPDRFYLWKNGDASHAVDEPDYEVDPRSILEPYFRQLGLTPEEISGQSFELLIASWLNEIMHSDEIPATLDEYKAWLVESGLYDELVGGRLAHEVFA